MPGACGNAAEYALKRLEEAEEPMGPAELADEYDCTRAHMTDTLSNLYQAGAVERVAHGRYAPSESMVGDSLDESAEELVGVDDSGDSDASEDGDDSEDGDEFEESESPPSPSLPISTTTAALVALAVVTYSVFIQPTAENTEETREELESARQDSLFVGAE
jgi:hypothetical protein